MANSKYEYVKKFEMDDKLPACNWIIVRIDGHKFHQFSDDHDFDKPNDENALNLMNSCAVSMVEHFPDIVFAYGVSDEYSKILSLSVSYFTSLYVIKWKDFFPHKGLKETPCFDGRIVLYPRAKIVRDYLSWRQVDCHINNQYNTCFWMLVKSGKTKKEAQERLKGTLAKDKNELLFQQFGINYDKLPDIFKKGSCVYKDTVEETLKPDNGGNPVKRQRQRVTVGHFNIIDDRFWDEQPNILREN
ncbi:tRNA(His) guanylyltransferase 1-like isoform X2 [Phalaenopsis equestris]|uniref:tRNA(His) guanylyltransferase 1-like isoform X2 n=1 Tax=Phalaenopsis equestris TaxID=78828 RepID=UPI0009E5D595|nr:tRNA(His) guanylyltransferase 1-like isoform X2 [Phalaenopsis equestris]